MQTHLASAWQQDPQAAGARSILRNCVHCGFCSAVCPTYQLTGDELDSPRGRIYLIKQWLEGQPVTAVTQSHLDRCLTCGACEQSCPSGVQYRRLLDFARPRLEDAVPRSLGQAWLRRRMVRWLGDAARFTMVLRTAHLLRRWLPRQWRNHVPARLAAQPAVSTLSAARRMVTVQGCVQPALTPQTHAAAVRVLARCGIALETLPHTGCCGALALHLGDTQRAAAQARHNIDALWAALQSGAEAVVMSASGCGLMLKDYAELLRDDPAYAAKASAVSACSRDLAEVVAPALAGDDWTSIGQGLRVAYQSPCTLQHGQKLGGAVEAILQRCGYQLLPVAESHLCCGAAGTYALLQPALSGALRERKLRALGARQPQCIATANVGCQAHLAAHSATPVKHWIELLDQPFSRQPHPEKTEGGKADDHCI